MLTFWDAFKQVGSYPARKVANLAKLLARLVGSRDGVLTIGVLKRIEFSPGGMPEAEVLFLTVFLTVLLESCDGGGMRRIFAHGAGGPPAKADRPAESDESDDDGSVKAKTTKKEDLSNLRESLSVFLLQYLKSSPKDVEGSAFRSNLSAAIETCEGTSA